MDSSKTITLMEWCAGYGGIGLGLKRVFGERLRTIAYCELEGYAQANLISKMEKGYMDVAPIWSDVKTFPTQEFHGLVDIFSAGYPCQPFSTAGKRLGEEDPRHLWPFIQRAIKSIQPRFCFFENVRGHLTLGFKNICHDLGELGYEVVAGLFTAAECGAPHERQRLYILAHAAGSRRGENRVSGELWADMFIKSSCYSRRDKKREDDEKWPSRPGENQKEWEPKRTMVYPRHIGQEIQEQQAAGIIKSSGGEVESRLGRMSYGYKNRYDRLRLCGNGVVPQTAELAFKSLYKELIGE